MPISCCWYSSVNTVDRGGATDYVRRLAADYVTEGIVDTELADLREESETGVVIADD